MLLGFINLTIGAGRFFLDSFSEKERGLNSIITDIVVFIDRFI